MKRLLLLVVVLAFAVPSWSQQSTSAPASREDVLKLLEVTRVRSQLDLFMGGMIDQIKASMRQSFTAKVPDATEKQLKVLDTIADEMGSQLSTDELLSDMIPVYQRAYTKEDIRAIVDFYSTPAGKKLLDKTPQLMQEGMQVGSAYAQRKLAPWEKQIEARVREMMAQATEQGQ